MYASYERKGYGRHPLELLGRTAIVHLVATLNYVHLQHSQKVSSSNRTIKILRTVLFILMPPLVLAELALNLIRGFITLTQSDPSKWTSKDVLNSWKRYLCGLGGMHVVPQPGLVELDDIEESGEQNRTTTAFVSHRSPKLSSIRDAADLQQHDKPWSWKLVVRSLVLILPILQGTGTIILWARRSRYEPAELDRRNFVAAISSIVCSLTSIIILSCRSEWSLNVINSAEANAGGFMLGSFFLELVIASIINEAPFLNIWDVVPSSWIGVLVHALRPTGVIISICLGLFAWLFVWLFNDKIKQKATINWHVVLALPMTVVTVWIFVDLIAFIVCDVDQMFAYPGSYIWDQDPIAVYLPIC